MSSSHPAVGASSGRRAVLLSCAFHAAVVAPLLCLPRGEQGSPTCDNLVLDTRADPPGLEVRISLLAEASSPSPPVLQPAQQPLPVSPALPVPPALEEPAVPASVVQPDRMRNANSARTGPEQGSTATQSGSPAGGGRTTSCFQVVTQARTIVYLLDRSASMGPRGSFVAAKRELLASVERLPEATCFQVIVYNRMVESLRIGGRTDLVPATPENKLQAARLLQSLRAEGMTEPFPALKQALALQPDVIYLLTDAGEMKLSQVREITQRNRGHTVIHAIELGSEQRHRNDPPLRLLAGSNRGIYRAVVSSQLSVVREGEQFPRAVPLVPSLTTDN